MVVNQAKKIPPVVDLPGVAETGIKNTTQEKGDDYASGTSINLPEWQS